jgi:predicted heme/steroid binding protein
MRVEQNLSEIIFQFQNEICYYNQMQILALCPYQKSYYKNLIAQRTEEFIELMGQHISEANGTSRDLYRQKEFTIKELSTYDGAGGRQAYVAVDGIVYDVSLASKWGGGTHFGLYAGKDLTSEFMGCHKGMLEILKVLPKVGVLK